MSEIIVLARKNGETIDFKVSGVSDDIVKTVASTLNLNITHMNTPPTFDNFQGGRGKTRCHRARRGKTSRPAASRKYRRKTK